MKVTPRPAPKKIVDAYLHEGSIRTGSPRRFKSAKAGWRNCSMLSWETGKVDLKNRIGGRVAKLTLNLRGSGSPVVEQDNDVPDRAM